MHAAQHDRPRVRGDGSCDLGVDDLLPIRLGTQPANFRTQKQTAVSSLKAQLGKDS